MKGRNQIIDGLSPCRGRDLALRPNLRNLDQPKYGPMCCGDIPMICPGVPVPVMYRPDTEGVSK